jgi:hypothetical protein
MLQRVLAPLPHPPPQPAPPLYPQTSLRTPPTHPSNPHPSHTLPHPPPHPHPRTPPAPPSTPPHPLHPPTPRRGYPPIPPPPLHHPRTHPTHAPPTPQATPRTQVQGCMVIGYRGAGGGGGFKCKLCFTWVVQTKGCHEQCAAGSGTWASSSLGTATTEGRHFDVLCVRHTRMWNLPQELS